MGAWVDVPCVGSGETSTCRSMTRAASIVYVAGEARTSIVVASMSAMPAAQLATWNAHPTVGAFSSTSVAVT